MATKPKEYPWGDDPASWTPNAMAPYWSSVNQNIDWMPENWLQVVAGIESKGGQNLTSPTGAVGPFQFTNIAAKQVGIPKDKLRDPFIGTLGAATLADFHRERFLKAMKREPTGYELYMMHQQGPGAISQMKTAADNPNATVNMLNPTLRKNILDQKVPGITGSSTVSDFLRFFENKYNTGAAKWATDPLNTPNLPGYGGGDFYGDTYTPAAISPTAPADPYAIGKSFGNMWGDRAQSIYDLDRKERGLPTQDYVKIASNEASNILSNYGLTQGLYDRYQSDLKHPLRDVDVLPAAEAGKIWDKYWDDNRDAFISPTSDLGRFDAGWADNQEQTAYNNYRQSAGLGTQNVNLMTPGEASNSARLARQGLSRASLNLAVCARRSLRRRRPRRFRRLRPGRHRQRRMERWRSNRLRQLPPGDRPQYAAHRPDDGGRSQGPA